MSTLLKLSVLGLVAPLMIGCIHSHHHHDRCEDDRVLYRSYEPCPPPRHYGYHYEVQSYGNAGRWGGRCD